MTQKLGDGCQGDVYKAKNQQNKEFAIKLYNQKQLSGFDQEVTAMRRIGQHENLVSLVDADRYTQITDASGDLFQGSILVQELQEFGCFFDLLIGNEPMSDDMIRYCMKQLLSGVKHMHENNFVHMDLKPENVLVNKNGTLKICDFGFAREHNNS